MTVPKVFISYSHDSPEHRHWILNLAIRLRNNGIDAILDQFELKPGDDIPIFMERHLSNSDKIIMVCTEKYVHKAENGVGGVGYEKMIITSHLMSNIDVNKVIPIIRQANTSMVPTFLKTKLHINFNFDDQFEFSFDELVRTIHGAPLFEKPPVGNNPFKPIEPTNFQTNVNAIDEIMKVVAKKYNEENDSSRRYVAIHSLLIETKLSRLFVEITLSKIMDLQLLEYVHSNSAVRITEKGKLYALERGFA